MDFNATIDLIIRDLDEAREIIDDLKKYPGVPALQIELAKSKCKSAGEVISLLKSFREDAPTLKKEPVHQTLNQKPQDKPPLMEEKEIVSGSPDFIHPSEDKEPEQEPSDIISAPVVKDKESPITTKKQTDFTIIADSFSHLSSRFNEQIGSRKSEDDVSGHLKTKHLDRLSDAIGLNDRFLFIREIFNGNKDAYIQAISRLENTESMKDAMAVIMSYTGENDENEAVKQLLDLVKRKLTPNE